MSENNNWKIARHPDGRTYIDGPNGAICNFGDDDGEGIHHAITIVTAVNNYGRMREALKAVLPLWQREDVADEWNDEFREIEAILTETEGK